MNSTLKNFRNAKWFRRHPYAYGLLLRRKIDKLRNRPFIFNAELCFDVTCNYTCKHCSISIFQEQKETRKMTFAQIEHVADELRGMHCFTVCLVGGEPTIRRDFPDIINAFHKRHILTTMITNGYFIDEYYLQKLIKAGLFSIGISLNGFSATSHDNFVQKKGAYDKQLSAIDLALKAGLSVSIAVVPTHANIANGDYKKLMEFAKSKGLRVNVNYPALAGQFTDKYDQLLTPDELVYARQFFAESHVTSDFTVMGGTYECPAGRKKIYITPDGSVCPCTFIHIKFGNILEEPLSQIMQRMWGTHLLMSRPKLCLTGESEVFNRMYLSPVWKSKSLPMDYREHPLYEAGAF